MRQRLVVRSLLAWLFLRGAADAQVVLEPRRLEVGGGAGLLVKAVGGGDGFFIISTGPRLTVNASPRDAIEVVFDAVYPVEGGGLNGLYLLQYKRLLTSRSPGHNAMFLTAGGGGSFVYDREKEYRWERPDGSIYVEPGYTDAALTQPFLGLVGVGFERIVGRSAAIRSEMQAYFFRFGAIGLKGHIGVSIPIGGYREH